jgi:hypothetical protein
MQVVTFQVVNMTDFNNKVFKLDDNGNNPFTDQFNLMGYNSLYLIQNFGTLCLTIFVTPLVWLVSVILRLIFANRFN